MADVASQPVPNYTPPKKPTKLTAEPSADETVKETIESIVIAFILAFVFRAFIVEPFIIPTGSMAPTLLGAHLQMACPSCGYRFDVGIDSRTAAEGAPLSEAEVADCPMCNYPVVAEVGRRVRSGDRILVDKFSYHLTDPSRWDVVVFKAPQGEDIGGEPAPRTNFIKRLVALPGERVCLLDGNVYVAPAGTDDFVIARKTDPDQNRHWQSIQRAIWQPVYYSQYVPIQDGGAKGPGRDTRQVWRTPWEAESGQWNLGSVSKPSRVYRFAGGSGLLRFAMDGPYGTLRYDEHDRKFPYNAVGSRLGTTRPIEDIRLSCAVTPSDGDMLLKLSTTARLDRPEAGVETLEVRLTDEGAVSLHAVAPSGEERMLGQEKKVARLRPGIATQIELWLVDDEASVWVEGERVLVQRFDLTWQQVAKRAEQPLSPEVKIGVESAGPVELRRVELDRDIYYHPKQYGSTIYGRAEARRRDGAIGLGQDPLDLRSEGGEYDAEFFVLGDNQPASEDGRGWEDVDGWVRQRYFDGQQRLGVVPRSLFVGRAFMVYYPAPHGTTQQDKGIFPDFGRARFIH